jgi:hypothetical protein
MRALRWCALVGGCWLVVRALPSVGRYLRMRAL